MKVIKNKRVYDLDYGAYETVVQIPSDCGLNAAGNAVETLKELRRDKASGLFYVLCHEEGYSRSQYRISPVTEDEAAKIAEDFLDYDRYVVFFGDPEGVGKGLERERDEALRKAKDAESNKDYWYREYQKRGEKVAELERRIAELELEAEK